MNLAIGLESEALGMFVVLCFLLIFFAIVLGAYLGLELVSVRRTERIYRTMIDAAAQSTRAMSALAEANAHPDHPESNYFAK